MNLLLPGLSYQDVGLRILAALLAGILVGVERESHGRAAGLRTTILVCVAACLAMMLSAALSASIDLPNITARPDPARLAAGVLSGMGFLGAGAILRNGNRVQGLTTAATMWFVTMLGLAIGAGYFVLAGVGMLVALLVLIVLPPIERLVKNDWYATVSIQLRMDAISEDDLHTMLESQGVRVKNLDLHYDLTRQTKTLNYELKFKKDSMMALSAKIVQMLIKQEGVESVRWS